MPSPSPRTRFTGLAGLLVAIAACSGGGEKPERPAVRPNLLWIVWDTVRADHLSLYGYSRPTTPFLDEWAKQARVFDDVLSVAGYTLASHASMFTGLLPSEHCTHNQHRWLDDSFTTVAELLRDAGYRTFLFSANPHVARAQGGNLAQGFERTEHPWSPKWAPEARRIILDKLPPEDRSSELPQRLEAVAGGAAGTAWDIKAAGALAGKATLEWLQSGDDGRPWFVFLNYMEAHRPTTPPRRLRERLLAPEDVEKSYQVDRSWLPIWEYTFGLREYSDAEIELIRATYDATLLELDELLRDLLADLRRAGQLENTVVILTSDHGEHLGEAHMLDHQHSLHQVLLDVPLVIHYPPRVPPGRETRPVMNFDLFPTVLELLGVPPPPGLRSQAVSLLDPQPERRRFAESGAFSGVGVVQVKRAHPDFDPTPFLRTLRALVVDSKKFRWGSDGRHALYDLESDPLETRDLLPAEPALAVRLEEQLDSLWRSLDRCDVASLADPAGLSREQRRMLEGLGYLEEQSDAPDAR
jgi:arylsulfatase A-like enzyme